jgi:adenylate cyclase
MRDTSVAGEEIERTLRVERDGVERQIARFRVWFFVVITATGPLFALVGLLLGKPPIGMLVPTLFNLCSVSYALALRWYVQRVGAKSWLIYLSLTLDQLAIAAPGVLFGRFDPAIAGQMLLFGVHLSAPGQFMVLFVNMLRMNGRASVLGACTAIVLVLGMLVPLEGMQPPIVGLVCGLAFTGLVGLLAARRARHSLDTFARMQLLRRFLPASAVERVLTDAPDTVLALGGRLTTVTLISSDLRGFTTMSEKLAPEEVVRQLNDYLGRMVDEIDAHGGALDKFMGDGILAVFGMQAGSQEAPDAGAAAAVACARGMLGALQGLNLERAKEGLPPLSVGIGVHTGRVVAGNIGAPGKRLESTVIGDAVNTVSRLEGLTKDAGRPLLVSQATMDRLGAAHDFEPLAPMAVRGRAEPLQAYALPVAA